MSTESAGGAAAEGAAAAEERSGETVAEAVDVAAQGSQSGGTERDPEDAHPHDAPVEQVRDDPDMTGAAG